MKASEIESLHDRAEHLYVAGLYHQAKHAWEEILSRSPADERAAEGVRMIAILSSRGAARPAERTERRPAFGSGHLEEELAQIEEIERSRRFGEAMEAAATLRSAYPDSVEARVLEARIREKFEAEPFISGELERAKRAWQSGHYDVVRASCARILALDPYEPMAGELIQAAEAVASGAEVLPDPAPADELQVFDADPGQAAPILDDELVFQLGGDASAPAEESVADGGFQGLVHASESPSGSLFDVDPGAEATALPLALDDGDASADVNEPDPQMGTPDWSLGPSVGAFEEEPVGETFSDLESEIDETIGSVASADDPSGGASTSRREGEPPGFPGSPASEGAIWSDPAAAASGPSRGPGPRTPVDPRLVAFVEEARAFLRAGRCSEAIETASRAFAIDEDAPGAQELIDQARAKLDEVDRQAEEHLYNAQRFLEEGDSDAAEALLREILRTHPGHREALDTLERMGGKEGKTDAVDFTLPASAPAGGSSEASLPPGQYPASIPLRETVRVGKGAAVEPFTPRPIRAEGSEPEARPKVDAAPATVTVAAPGKSRGYRVLLLALVSVILIVAAAFGLLVLPKLFIGGDEIAAPPVESPRLGAGGAVGAGETTGPKAVEPPPAPPAVKPPERTPGTIEQARELVAEGKLEQARGVLSEIAALDPGNVKAADLLRSVDAKLQEREASRRATENIHEAFRQDRYEDALRLLYRLPEQMQSGEVERFKRNAWYNSGVLYMTGGNRTEAMRCLKEATALDPGDAGAKRLIEYLESNWTKEKDAAYFQYVESLPKRKIDER